MKKDLQFSVHKDRELKPLWEELSHEGRYVLTASSLLQQEHGIDVILQGYDEDAEKELDITVDTKHVRGQYSSFYLEEMSCTTPGKEKDGWLLKEDGWPDYIYYCYWPQCEGCKDKLCDDCEKELESKVYVIEYVPLRNWFLRNRTDYLLSTNKYTVNRTTGRLVPVADLGGLILEVYGYPE